MLPASEVTSSVAQAQVQAGATSDDRTDGASPMPAQPPLPVVAAAAAAAAAAAELAAWPAGRDGTVALHVDCRVFDRILLTLDMVSDHLPDAYLSAIRNLR